MHPGRQPAASVVQPEPKLVPVEVKTRKAEQAEATRAALIKTARGLFAKQGYASVPIEEIVRRAGVTRGALYHHFRDKAELLGAVADQLAGEVAEKVQQAAWAQPRPEKHLEVGFAALLDASLDPAFQRIVLTDAPAVLGWEAWREIDAKHGYDMVAMAVEAAMDGRYIERQPVEPLAHMLLGALNEGALMIARADDEKAARRQVGRSLSRLLDGLKPRSG